MKRKFIIVLAVMGVLIATNVVLAQTATPAGTSGAPDAQTEAALKDLSAVYGSPVVREDQARAICNQEQYFLDCAEIGKKHDLFDDKRIKEVDVILNQLKGQVVDDIKQCSDVECLVGVATEIAKKFNSASPSIARSVDLTPQKVTEKRTIVDAAKIAGVDFEDCRTMDPDNASVELLRGCAKLAKSESIQKFIPKESREQAERVDTSIALKESLAKGEIQCGDGTLNGCGNFCLNPTQEARKLGVTAIPPVCNQIAEKFFGKSGVEELKRAYSSVQDKYNSIAGQSEKFVFTTIDGQKLTDQASIGRYMEEAGRRGDVEAIRGGMDFLVQNSIVSEKDRDFALTMVGKIRDRGSRDFDFDKCRSNPEACADLIPEENRAQFTAMGQIEKVMRAEMEKRGITDPSKCESDPSIREACMAAAKTALPQIEDLAGKSKETGFIVADIRQKIRFGEEGIEARKRVEKSFESGEFAIGEQKFRSMNEVEEFCRRESQTCLAETTKSGVFSRNIATEKYEQAVNHQYSDFPPYQPQYPADLGAPSRNVYPSPNYPYPAVDKADALKQFEKWLDNPSGPPPMPTIQQPNVPYSPYNPYPSPYYNQQYNYGTTTAQRQVCPYASAPYPCRAGEYRQESVNESGCGVYSACIPISTKTSPPPIDSIDRHICPALATVSSCPAGEEKTVTYSSPECGTYYACSPVKTPESGIKFPYTLANGKIVVSIEDARAYCRGYDPLSGQGIATECEIKFGVVVPTSIAPGTDCTRYGSGWHSMDGSGNCFNPNMTEYKTPAGTLQYCSTSSVYGCSGSSLTNVSQPPTGQKEQIWNSLGLRSWIRTDADTARVESLKQACSGVRSQDNVWKPDAGTQSSVDFGMPDSAKCATASSCASTQYFNGSTCTTSTSQNTNTSTSTPCATGQYWNGSSCVTSPPSCTSGQYWNGTSCVATTPYDTPTVSGSCSSELTGLLGSGCHNMGNAWFNGSMTSYVMPGTSVVRECGISNISGCSGSYTQTNTGGCASGQYWNGSSCVASSPSTSCTSGQYWNGTSCVTSSTSYSSDPQTGCAQAGGTWNSTTNYCQMPSTTSTGSSSCTSGQYWNGTSCVASAPAPSPSTSCGSGQYWNGSSCVTSSSAPAPSTSCPSDQYWNGSSCVANTPAPAPTPSTSCPSDQYWNGTSCVASAPALSPSTSCGSGQYWNGSSCVTSSSAPAPSTSCGSGQYWNGSSCVASSPPVSYFCPKNHDWNGSYCSLAVRSPLEQGLANVFSALFGLFNW